MQNYSRTFRLLAVIILLCALPFAGMAENLNGLSIELNTDKKAYSPQETATVTVTIANNGGLQVENLVMEPALPNSLTYTSTNNEKWNFAVLEPGKSITTSFQVAMKDPTLPATGDSSEPWLWSMLLVVSFTVFLCLFKKYRNIRIFSFFLSLILCFSVSNSISEIKIKNGYTTSVHAVFDNQIQRIDIHFSWELPANSIDSMKGLKTNVEFIPTGIEKEVSFSVETIGSKNSAIYLMDENNNAVSAMVDNGENGDVISGDGIYTCTLKLSAEHRGHYTYYAQSGDIESNTVTIAFFEPFTSESFAAYKEICSQIQEVEAPYLDENGYVKSEHLKTTMEAVEQYLSGLYAQGNVLKINAGRYSIAFWMYDGLQVFYTPRQYGVNSSGEANSIYVLESKTEYWDVYWQDKAEQPEDSAVAIENAFSDIVFKAHNDREWVTVDRFLRAMQSNSIILFDGHGGAIDTAGEILSNESTDVAYTFIMTGEDVTEASHTRYRELGYIHFETTDGNQTVYENCLAADYAGKWAILPKLIRDHCDLSNSFVFSTACYSGWGGAYDSIAEACLDKGAAYAGFTYAVSTNWARSIQATTLEKMCEVNPDTGWLYSLSEAAEIARKTHFLHMGGDLAAEFVTFTPDGNEYYLKTETPITGKLMDSDEKLIPDVVTLEIYDSTKTTLLQTWYITLQFTLHSKLTTGNYHFVFSYDDTIVEFPVTINTGIEKDLGKIIFTKTSPTPKAAILTGRFVDSTGQEVGLGDLFTIEQYSTDKSIHFTTLYVFSGFSSTFEPGDYYLIIKTEDGVIIKEIPVTLESGKTYDLGDIVVDLSPAPPATVPPASSYSLFLTADKLQALPGETITLSLTAPRAYGYWDFDNSEDRSDFQEILFGYSISNFSMGKTSRIFADNAVIHEVTTEYGSDAIPITDIWTCQIQLQQSADVHAMVSSMSGAINNSGNPYYFGEESWHGPSNTLHIEIVSPTVGP